jgi:RimJ/RimL family protein N-acetyltransferase
MAPDPEISIRRYQAGDAQALFEAARESTATVFPWFGWCRPDYSLDDARSFIAGRDQAFRCGSEYDFAIVSADGRFLGGCGLNAIRWHLFTANLGHWIRSSERGRGVAVAAVGLLVAWAGAHTRLRRIELLIAPENAVSLRVAEKAGALREGVARGRLSVHGVLHDAVVFSFSL